MNLFIESGKYQLLRIIQHICEDMHAVLTHKVYEDGYKWSKCNRRRVVRGEYIRHYYRCRKANCKTRKKIICFANGKITKIKYDGDIHNHRKPQHLELVVCLKKILIKEKCIKKCMKVSIDRDIFIFDIIIVIFILFLNV